MSSKTRWPIPQAVCDVSWKILLGQNNQRLHRNGWCHLPCLSTKEYRRQVFIHYWNGSSHFGWATTLLENLVQLEWRNINFAHRDLKAWHWNTCSHTRELLALTSLLTQNTAVLHGQSAQAVLLNTQGRMGTLPLVSLWKDTWAVEQTIVKEVMTQVHRDFCCSVKAGLKEKMISATHRDPLSAVSEKLTDSINISWVCCSHLCSS